MPTRDHTTAAGAAVERAWAATVDEVLTALGADVAHGLARHEVRRRRERWGPNLLRERKRIGAWRILAEQFRSLVVALLVAAVVVSIVFAQWLEAAAIGVVILVNAAIGFVTELRAVRSMEALGRLGVATAKVRRDGQAREVAADALVPGDVLLLEAGDVVTADLRLIEASLLEANESTLTGESAPVAKGVEPAPADAPLAERSSMLWKGTALTRGSGVGVVVATGMATELGRIASLATEAEQSATPLEQRLDLLGRRLVWVTLGIATATIGAGILRGRPPLLMVETGLALAVAAIPEGLPIVATLALARGMWRMARRHALINRLPAVETLGATTVIMTDKTGTLTENRMSVVRIALAGGDVEVEGRGLEPAGTFRRGGTTIDPAAEPALRIALEVGVLCNNAALSEGPDGPTAVGDPMEAALVVAGRRAGLEREALLAREPEEREEAFDPQARAMATVHARGDAHRIAVKGAAESLLPACTRVLGHDGTITELDEDARRAWEVRAERLADEGLRVLLLAEKTVDSPDAPPYQDLTLLGLVGLLDPPRHDVKEALDLCRQAGVRVVMVTGDQAQTAVSVARALGLVGDDGTSAVVRGPDLPDPDGLSDADRRRLRDVAVFARVDPEQKLRLIEVHQDAGAVVAMTGDGVNDAPALSRADIGVAMGKRGTQVAREAADMVLQDDSFGTIVGAIRQGRVIFTNIRRFVLYLLSCNISEILIVFAASVLGGELPILPLQILYLNLVTDVFPALALGFGEGDPQVMQRPPRPPSEPILAPRHWLVIGGYGLVIAACVLAALHLAQRLLGFPPERAVTVSFLTLAFAQVWHVFDMRAHGSRLLRNDVVGNPWVWGAVAVCTVLALAAVYAPGLAPALRTQAPGAAGWSLALGASVVPLAVGQAWLTLHRSRWA